MEGVEAGREAVIGTPFCPCENELACLFLVSGAK